MTDSTNTDAPNARAHWLLAGPVDRHLAVTQDLADGIVVALELVEREALACEDSFMEGRGYAPTLMPHEADGLMKLAIAAARSIAEQTERMRQWADKHGAEAPR